MPLEKVPFKPADDFPFAADDILHDLIHSQVDFSPPFSTSAGLKRQVSTNSVASSDSNHPLSSMVDSIALSEVSAPSTTHEPAHMQAYRDTAQPFAYYEAHAQAQFNRTHSQQHASDEEVRWHNRKPPPSEGTGRRGAPGRPNVDYFGQHPVLQMPLPRSASSHNSKFSADPYERNVATSVDVAIEQASFMNMQKILTRKIPVAEAPSQPYNQSSSHMHRTAFREENAYDRSDCTSDLSCAESGDIDDRSLRRSFDAITATRPAKQKVKKKQHENKNWFSYDEGLRGNNQPNSNEAWFLALQRRHAERAGAPPEQELPTRRVRPQSSGGTRASSSNSRPHSQVAPHAHPPEEAQYSPTYPHRKYPVYDHERLLPHNIPAGFSTSPAHAHPSALYAQHTDASSGKIRPTSAGARYSSAPRPVRPSPAAVCSANTGEGAFARPQAVPVARTAVEEFYSSHARAAAAPWDNTISAPHSSGKYQHQQDRAAGELARRKNSTGSAAGMSSKKHKQKVKERISATYIA